MNYKILIIFLLINSISSSPFSTTSESESSTTSATTASSSSSSEEKSNEEKILQNSEDGKPQFPENIDHKNSAEVINVLPIDLSSKSGEDMLEGWFHPGNNATTIKTELSSSSSSSSETSEDVVDNHTEKITTFNRRIGGQQQFRGIYRSAGQDYSNNDNNATANNKGDDDTPNGFGSIDPCPVLKFLCFQDPEYCPAFHVYCDETGSQEAFMKHTVDCVVNWIAGKTPPHNCSTLFG